MRLVGNERGIHSRFGGRETEEREGRRGVKQTGGASGGEAERSAEASPVSREEENKLQQFVSDLRVLRSMNRIDVQSTIQRRREEADAIQKKVAAQQETLQTLQVGLFGVCEWRRR